MTNSTTLILAQSAEFTGILTGEEKTLLVTMGNAAGKYENTRKALAGLMAAHGWTGWVFDKEYLKLCSKEEEARLREAAATIKTSLAKGMYDKAHFALWVMDAKEANKAGKQTERNRLTSKVNTYFNYFRKMLDDEYLELHPEEMERIRAEGKEEKEKADKEEKAPTMAGDVRAMLKALILEVAGSDCPNRDVILADLNHAESLMTW